MSNNMTRKTERQRIKKKLRAWGMDEKEIKLCLLQVSIRQIEKLNGQIPKDAPLCTRAEYVRLLKKQLGPNDKQAPQLHLGEYYVAELDDKGYAPTKVDSLLTGMGRAMGQTAKVIKRGKTITKYQHDQGE